MPQNEPTKQPPGRHEASWAGLFLLAALMLVAQPLPWALLGALPALGALVLGIRATLLRARGGARAAAVWSGFGVFFATWLLVDVVASAVLYGPLSEYSQCNRAANTDIAQGTCVDQLSRRIGNSAHLLVG